VAWRDLIQILPHAAIAIAAALLTILFQARAQHYGLIPDSLDYRVARAGAAIWLYLGALVWPGGISPIRPPWLPNLHSPVTYLPALAAAGTLGLLYWKRRGWGRPLLFAYGYFLIMLAPVLGFVWMTLMQETPVADWWQYMAAPGIFACAAAGCDAALRRWRAAMPVLCVAVCLLLVQTWRRAAIYESMESYCRAVTAEDPAAWTLENNLGIVLKRRGRFAEAEACYRRALEANPEYVEARLNLGNALSAAGDLDGAKREFEIAAQMRPGDSHALAGLASLGGLYAGRGRYAEAAGALREALKMDTGSIPLRIELCEALAAQGDKEGALRVCTEVEQLAARSGDPAAIDAAARLRKDCEGGRE
jgi:Flp pilus assembly protein TadD